MQTWPLKQFTWGERYIDDLILRTRDLDDNGSIDETLYAVQDANWDVTALVDASGTVVERFRYDPYGRNLVLDDDFTVDPDGKSDFDWEYRFTSREYDAETGLHYFRARYWHPDLGRFIGRDPLGYVDGASLYAGYFVPGGVDPMGESFLDFLFGTGKYAPPKVENKCTAICHTLEGAAVSAACFLICRKLGNHLGCDAIYKAGRDVICKSKPTGKKSSTEAALALCMAAGCPGCLDVFPASKM